MILFKENTASVLSDHILGRFVESILIASYGLAIQIDDVTIHCNETVKVNILGTAYEWEDSPTDIPFGLLVRDKVVEVKLFDERTLRILLESGSFIDVETDESEYESVIINYPKQGENLVMDIY